MSKLIKFVDTLEYYYFVIVINIISISVSKSLQSATIRSRLEELEEFDDQMEYSEKELYDLTQQEFVMHMDNLGKEIIEAWNNEQRVKALKIVIQVFNSFSIKLYSIRFLTCIYNIYIMVNIFSVYQNFELHFTIAILSK